VYRVTPGAACYRWLRHDSVVVLEAHDCDGIWHLCLPGSTQPVLTLLGVAVATGTAPALVDPDGSLVASLTIPETGTPTVAVVRDRDDSVVTVARGDGPGAIHLVDARGEVTALASRAGNGRRVGLDVLVTRPTGDEALLFGILLGLELLRLGHLRVAS